MAMMKISASFPHGMDAPGYIDSFILAISIAPLRVHYYSEALPTSARIVPKRTGNCK